MKEQVPVSQGRFTCPQLRLADSRPGPGWGQPWSLWPRLERPLPAQTSVFTPAYGSVTNVRVNSTMTAPQVLALLLNKFRVSVAGRPWPRTGGFPAALVVGGVGDGREVACGSWVDRLARFPCWALWDVKQRWVVLGMCVALGVWLMPRVSVSRLGKPPSDFSLPCRWKMAPVSSHSTLSMSLGVSLTCQVFSGL